MSSRRHHIAGMSVRSGKRRPQWGAAPWAAIVLLFTFSVALFPLWSHSGPTRAAEDHLFVEEAGNPFEVVEETVTEKAPVEMVLLSETEPLNPTFADDVDLEPAGQPGVEMIETVGLEEKWDSLRDRRKQKAIQTADYSSRKPGSSKTSVAENSSSRGILIQPKQRSANWPFPGTKFPGESRGLGALLSTSKSRLANAEDPFLADELNAVRNDAPAVETAAAPPRITPGESSRNVATIQSLADAPRTPQVPATPAQRLPYEPAPAAGAAPLASRERTGTPEMIGPTQPSAPKILAVPRQPQYTAAQVPAAQVPAAAASNQPPPRNQTASTTGSKTPENRVQVDALMRQARLAYVQGRIEQARQLARSADDVVRAEGVTFGPGEVTPQQLLYAIGNAPAPVVVAESLPVAPPLRNLTPLENLVSPAGTRTVINTAPRPQQFTYSQAPQYTYSQPRQYTNSQPRQYTFTQQPPPYQYSPPPQFKPVPTQTPQSAQPQLVANRPLELPTGEWGAVGQRSHWQQATGRRNAQLGETTVTHASAPVQLLNVEPEEDEVSPAGVTPAVGGPALLPGIQETGFQKAGTWSDTIAPANPHNPAPKELQASVTAEAQPASSAPSGWTAWLGGLGVGLGAGTWLLLLWMGRGVERKRPGTAAFRVRIPNLDE